MYLSEQDLLSVFWDFQISGQEFLCILTHALCVGNIADMQTNGDVLNVTV